MNSKEAEAVFDATIARYEDEDQWLADGERSGWRMPRINQVQRLPIVRHWYGAVRVMALAWRSERTWGGRVPPGFEREIWEACGIWKGWWR